MSTLSRKPINENAIEDEIARRAYELWEQDGYKHGNHAKHWDEAERELRGSKDGNPAYPSKGERDRMIGSNEQHDEPVAKIPAGKLKRLR